HIPGTESEVNEYAHGSLGTVNFGRGSIEFKDGTRYRYRGENSDPYQVEHDRLFAAIRNNTEHHEAEFGAYSTLTSILGRMATYSGKLVTWAQALQSEVDLSPAEYSWESPPPVLPDAQGRYPIATPGVTQPF
ncbi:MAG: dehydrogenase, partial [Planctomycetes bacterium]|nr:dehydrogenase [Planctomycetota bacterium]